MFITMSNVSDNHITPAHNPYLIIQITMDTDFLKKLRIPPPTQVAKTASDYYI